MKAPTAALAGILAAGVLGGGCASDGSAEEASMGVLSSEPIVITLGAGDALGWAIYGNDIILTARMNRAAARQAVVTDGAE